MQIISKHRSLIPLFGFSISLLIIRMMVAQNFVFLFLLWNLFLSIVPLFFSHQLTNTRQKQSQYLCFVLWLIFFPNSAYIITDLFHFYERPPIARWYDLIFLFSTALNGLIAGFLSLLEIEKWLSMQISKKWIQPIIAFMLLLSAFGIYLGRYLRFNSWDILIHPIRLSRGLAAHVFYPTTYAQSWLLTIVFGIWFYLFYNGFKKLYTHEKITA